MSRILIVDDEEAILKPCRVLLDCALYYGNKTLRWKLEDI